MSKTILITGATDGIGLETARWLVALNHRVLLHGRSQEKLEATRQTLLQQTPDAEVETYRADLSQLEEVQALASDIAGRHAQLDVVINNAGVFKTPNPVTDGGHDLRFIVNTVAPYLLTQELLPLLPPSGRVINLSSAAQAPVDLQALAGGRHLSDNAAYAQSKLAITMWSCHMAQSLQDAPVIVAVNPASFLASKMVKEAYGVAGTDLGVGADILVRAATGDDFANASGKYFDNDNGRFASPHPDALDPVKNAALVQAIEALLVQQLD